MSTHLPSLVCWLSFCIVSWIQNIFCTSDDTWPTVTGTQVGLYHQFSKPATFSVSLFFGNNLPDRYAILKCQDCHVETDCNYTTYRPYIFALIRLAGHEVILFLICFLHKTVGSATKMRMFLHRWKWLVYLQLTLKMYSFLWGKTDSLSRHVHAVYKKHAQ